MQTEHYIIETKQDKRKLLSRLTKADIDNCEVIIKKRVRTIPMNSRLHAILTEVANSDLTFAGKRRSMLEWKAIFVSGHAVATSGDSDAELVEGIEGEALQLRESTATMSVARSSSLMEYISAYAADKGLRVTW
jgi:hypothetical protein